MDGLVLKRLIKQSGMTQEEFALKLGASRSTVILLTQKGVISQDWKDKICQALNVATDVWTSQANKDYPSIGNNEKVLTANERQALWDIINTQKEIISRLERQVKDGGGNKE